MSAPRRYADESSERGWTRIASQKFSGPGGWGTKCLVCAASKLGAAEARWTRGPGRQPGRAVGRAPDLIPFAQLHRSSRSACGCWGPNGLGVAAPLAGMESRFAGRSSFKTGRVACPTAYDLGFLLGEVDHRCRSGAAVARVDHRIHGVIELLRNLPPLGHGFVLAGQQQGGRDERLAEFGQQRLGRHVARDPHPNGLLPRVLQSARHLLRRPAE